MKKFTFVIMALLLLVSCESQEPIIINDVEINCVSGTNDCYQITDNQIVFSNLKEDTIYSISGSFAGNILIEADAYKFELELCGVTISCKDNNPILITSGDKVSVVAKKDSINYIYDKRDVITDEESYKAAIHSECDLEICGKGSLNIISDNNNGIHSKDDLEIKNLNLNITALDNALKGNDSVEISSGNLNLISTKGDGIKTSNSSISDKNNQKGNVTITGGNIKIHASCDGIDAAHDVFISEETDLTLDIYTNSYSNYFDGVDVGSDIENEKRYIRFNSQNYKYSVKYYNSDSDYEFVNPTYYKSVSNGRSTYYYYSFPILTNYSKVKIYAYNSNQVQQQEDDYAFCTDYIVWNDAYDTFQISQRGNSLQYGWTSYQESFNPQFGGGFGGGMNEGNSDKLDYSAKGIKAYNEINIESGNIFIKSYDDAIHANGYDTLENGSVGLGNININGGNIEVYSNDDGIHADGNLFINAGNIKITNSYEGVEGSTILVNGGMLSITSKDDGMNGTSTTGSAITISGGNTYVLAGGDGIDSNSTTSYSGIMFKGGDVVVIQTSQGNSAIDCERGYGYTGGRVLAVMPRGGMTNEATNTNTTNITKTSISLSNSKYLIVNNGSEVECVIKNPQSLDAYIVYLGSSSVTLLQDTKSPYTLDENQIYWQ